MSITNSEYSMRIPWHKIWRSLNVSFAMRVYLHSLVVVITKHGAFLFSDRSLLRSSIKVTIQILWTRIECLRMILTDVRRNELTVVAGEKAGRTRLI